MVTLGVWWKNDEGIPRDPSRDCLESLCVVKGVSIRKAVQYGISTMIDRFIPKEGPLALTLYDDKHLGLHRHSLYASLHRQPDFRHDSDRPSTFLSTLSSVPDRPLGAVPGDCR